MTHQSTLEEPTVDDPVTESRSRVPRICPECPGRIVSEGENAEAVCDECGLVVDEQELDTGPEWRSFDSTERNEKSRAGAPMTPMMHDRGLSTVIGWQNKDANGSTLPSRKRQRLSRLRTWNERYRTTDSRDRNLKQALGEVDRMASALGVPKPTRETASVLYRQALENDFLHGRSIEGTASASLYAASRLDGIARSIDEVATVSRIDDIEIKRTYRSLARELDLGIPPTSPLEYLGRLVSTLECSNETERQTRTLLEDAIEQGVHSGKDPVGIAASALYAGVLLTNEDLTQGEIAEAANVSEVTIRKHYREVLAATQETDCSRG